VGFIWQSTGRNLLQYLTARENVELPMAIASVRGKERKERALELLASVGLSKHVDRLPGQLSGGEQQRVAIAVALANRPPLLLADEPTGELDTHSAVDVFRGLDTMARVMGATVVIVTHYPGVAQFVDRVAHIRDGRIDAELRMKDVAGVPGGRKGEEYLVVDRAGRVQLPQEFVEKLHLQGLVKVDMKSGQIYISRSNDEDAK
jgi:ABC-type lipoprotein export system ATPase subunit